MKRKAITAIITTMFLASILDIAFNTKPAVAQPYTWVSPELVVPPYAEAAGGNGWWFRHSTDWFMFNFTGIDTALIDNWVIVSFYLGVTNMMNGDGGLDGLVDVVINPGLTPTITYTGLLLDNIDSDNQVYAFGTGGSYSTYGQISVPKSYVIAGQLLINVTRHPDNPVINNPATPGTNAIIDMMKKPPIVPTGVYEGNDAHTVHIYLGTVDTAGNPVSGGDIVRPTGSGSVAATSDRLVAPMLLRADLNADSVVDIFDVVTITPKFGTIWYDPPGQPLQTQSSTNILMLTIAAATTVIFGMGMYRLRKKP